AVGGAQPVALAVGRRRHAHDRLVEVDVAGAAEAARGAEGEDAAVGGDHPVALQGQAGAAVAGVAVATVGATVATAGAAVTTAGAAVAAAAGAAVATVRSGEDLDGTDVAVRALGPADATLVSVGAGAGVAGVDRR